MVNKYETAIELLNKIHIEDKFELFNIIINTVGLQCLDDIIEEFESILDN